MIGDKELFEQGLISKITTVLIISKTRKKLYN